MRETAFTIRIALASALLSALWVESAQAEFRSRTRFKSRGKPYPSASRRNRGTTSNARSRSTPSFGGTGRVAPGTRTHNFSGNPSFPSGNAPTFLAPRAVVNAPSGPQVFSPVDPSTAGQKPPPIGPANPLKSGRKDPTFTCFGDGKLQPNTPLYAAVAAYAARDKEKLQKKEYDISVPATELNESFTLVLEVCVDSNTDFEKRYHAVRRTYQDLLLDGAGTKDCRENSGQMAKELRKSILVAAVSQSANAENDNIEKVEAYMPSKLFGPWTCYFQSVYADSVHGRGQRRELEVKVTDAKRELISARRLFEAFERAKKTSTGELDLAAQDTLVNLKPQLTLDHRQFVDIIVAELKVAPTQRTRPELLKVPDKMVAFAKSGFNDPEVLAHSGSSYVMKSWVYSAGEL